jgi:transglutaminase-like putative cysteine protease
MKLSACCRAVYHYEASVSFSPHVVRLFPRQDHGLRLRGFRFLTNAAAQVQHRRDLFDNWVARCFYPEPSANLRFEARLELEVEARNAFDFLLDASVVRFPFAYAEADRRALEPYLRLEEPDRVRAFPGWESPVATAASDTTRELVELNRALHAAVRYERREHGAPYAPAETLRRAAGSCRDIAVLHAAILRSHGVAVRLVSGFLFETGQGTRVADGALHLWTEAFLPGAGWLGFDPTNGVLCDHLYVPCAVGIVPDDVAPFSGSYYADRPVGSRLDAAVEILATGGGEAPV